MCKSYFLWCIVFSIETIIQTSLHLVFVVYGYYLDICESTPTEAPTMFFYLTYLYKQKCGHLSLQTLKGPPLFSLESFISALYYTVNSSNLTDIIQEILDKAQLPEYAPASSRTSQYLLCFIIADSIWIVSAVALIMGTFFRIKEAFSVIFYGPWLITTLSIMLIDIVATIHYGLDTFKTETWNDWLGFVGITNVQDFQDLDAKSPSALLSMAPTLIMLLITSRGVFFWILNLIGFVCVFKAAISAYRQSYKHESARNANSQTQHALELETSAARIRSWQLFYGATGSTSSNSEESNKTVNKDLQSNNKEKNQLEESQTVELSLADPNTGYYAYPDVTDSCMEELRGQHPWSYFPGAGSARVPKNRYRNAGELDSISEQPVGASDDCDGAVSDKTSA